MKKEVPLPSPTPIHDYLRFYNSNRTNLKTPLVVPILTYLIKEGRKLSRQDLPQKQILQRILNHCEMILEQHSPKHFELLQKLGIQKPEIIEERKELTTGVQCDNVSGVQDKKEQLMRKLRDLIDEKRKSGG